METFLYSRMLRAKVFIIYCIPPFISLLIKAGAQPLQAAFI